MRADVDALARLHHHDPVGQIQRRQAVGDDDRRPAAGELLQHLMNKLLAFQVDLAGRLVENQDGRVAEDCPGQGDPLPLAAREPIAELADHRFVAMSPTGFR